MARGGGLGARGGRVAGGWAIRESRGCLVVLSSIPSSHRTVIFNFFNFISLVATAIAMNRVDHVSHGGRSWELSRH